METKKIYLNGKYLLIDTENLEGHSTFDEANAIIKSQGKRPMSDEEQIALSECYSVWDKERKGRNFYIPTDESLSTYVRVFFPAAGSRGASAGALGYVGSYGYYWSSSPNSTSNGYYLLFNSGNVYPSYSYNRASGFSVRLVKDYDLLVGELILRFNEMIQKNEELKDK